VSHRPTPTPGASAGTTSTRGVQHWSTRAACRNADPELFFTPEGDRGNVVREREAKAKAVCGFCLVKADCLADALENGLVGVWGGTNDDERRAIQADKPITACGGPGGRRIHRNAGTPICDACLAYENRQQEIAALRNWANIAPLVERGLTLEDAAVELGLSFYTVNRARQAAIRAGLPMPAADDSLVLEVRHLISVGADIHEAARATRRTPAALQRALERRSQHALLAALKRAA
jgi:WhiB family redox-sensing transcriptional regulator